MTVSFAAAILGEIDMESANRIFGDTEPMEPAMPAGPARLRRIMLGMVSLGLALAIWLPTVHLFYPTTGFLDGKPIPPRVRELAARHLRLWTDPELRREEVARMRRSNAEWDFMGRSFLVWSLANMAMAEPDKQAEYLAVMDAAIDDTLSVEAQHGMYHFLMGYARCRPYIARPIRSQFVDSEIALMLAARRLVQEKLDYRGPLQERVAAMIERMEQSPILCAESYPNECWMFDNAVALAAIRAADRLDGTDHGEFIRRWRDVVERELVDPMSGLLVSSFSINGDVADGPEGSSIWFVSHCLQLIDPAFAEDQYRLARRAIGRTVCGFGYGREWPENRKGLADIDSGPIIPILGVSAGSSGLAFIGARSFGDQEFLSSLYRTLDFAAFPESKDGALRYWAGNQVGDAALLYGSVLGPLWTAIGAPQEHPE